MNATRCQERSEPKSLHTWRADPTVKSAEYYNGGFDSESGYGYEVVFKTGFRDAHGAHSVRTTTVAAMRAKLRAVTLCNCEACKGGAK